MSNISLKKYISAFKSFRGVLAGIGVLIPGYYYFTSYAPPLLNESSLLTAALAFATVIITYHYEPPQRYSRNNKLPPLVKLAKNVLIVSVVLLIVYLVLLRICTTVDRRDNKRYQIGFYKYEWSLTDEGVDVKTLHPNETPQDWMMDDALFRPGGPNVIWKSETIILSGIIMIVIFMCTFVLWTFGWALLAKQKTIGEE